MNIGKELTQFIKLKEREYNACVQFYAYKYKTYETRFEIKEPDLLLAFEIIKEFLNDKY
jgi:hypothetical protein